MAAYSRQRLTEVRQRASDPSLATIPPDAPEPDCQLAAWSETQCRFIPYDEWRHSAEWWEQVRTNSKPVVACRTLSAAVHSTSENARPEIVTHNLALVFEPQIREGK